VKTCYTQKYWLSKTEILQELELYLTTHFRSQVPNLVVSNIAWNSEENEQALQLLRSHGVQNIEVAPTKLCTWQDLDSFDADSYLSNLDRLGLKVDSAQAVTFGLPELQLFGTESSRHELFEHLCRVIAFVAKLKANLIVFGSPKNRSILDRMIPSEAESIAIEFFSKLADFAAQYSVCFCIEPNAKQYGCDFCTGAEEAAALVRRVNKPNFRLHFDTGCSEMEKEDCEVLIRVDSVLNHVHVSRPSLDAFSLNDFRIHQQWSKSLETINYTGKICIELACKSEQLNLSNLNDALLIVRAAYRNNLL
jgi:D-psicose/D-tagatose/L-ribulose 3-epimerase